MGVHCMDRRLIGNLFMGKNIRFKIEGEFRINWKRGKTRVPTLTYTVQLIYRRTKPRSTTGLGRRRKGWRKADEGAAVRG